MPTLQFSCPYTSRVGHCPGANGWTYHHILPVRYYWCAAYIMVKLIRLRNSPQDADLRGEFGIKKKSDFLTHLEDDIPEKTLRKNLVRLHNTPNAVAIQNLNQALSADLSQPDNICAAVDPLTGPKFGGFSGMNGSSHRCDDPGSLIEKTKPASFDQDRWDQIQMVGSILNQCIKKIAHQPNGPFDCVISDKQLVCLIASLSSLADNNPANAHPFFASDWKIKDAAGWCFLAGVPPGHQMVREGLCGNVFYLDANGGGGANQLPANPAQGVPLPPCVARTQDDPQKVQWVRIVPAQGG
ncbi:hypothetical protein OJF2_45540 [Aquisphaera giovannonii]|uniref:Uncharacterized protein n=1 Tax=Aquisphaera giovannonii TaxID=406548 RepID=A0A5B9W5P8_9BACT|nr:hypothetical protein [Aquisphaera giovannonii]QEH35996.1 hypothetical protein OJF2_45540 [Aquisphaera giovannonii]